MVKFTPFFARMFFDVCVYHPSFMIKQPETDLIVIAVFQDAFEAGISQDLLKQNEIDSFLEEENILGLNPGGGVELKVRRKDFQSARRVIEKQPH